MRCGALAVLMLLLPLSLLQRGETQEPPKLATEQEVIRGRYQSFEGVLDRMADLLGTADPDRAALVRRVLSKSKKDLLSLQFQGLIDRLNKAEWKEASDEQALLLEDLNALLELMLSEDRGKWLTAERKRVEAALRSAKELQRRQEELQGQTERSRGSDKEGKELAEQEGKLATETADLAKQLKSPGSDTPNDKESDGESPNKSEGDKEPATEEGEKAESPAEGDKQPDGDAQKSETPKGEPSPGDQPSPANAPGAGQDGSSESSPGAQSIQKAADAMRQAQEKLEALEKDPAAKEQEKAIAELRKAIEELEEVLRQLREEERIERLASLESRCRKMLEMQQVVLEGTTRLELVPSDSRTRVEEQQALALSRKEEEIAGEAEQALLVLREDGTAIAFFEAFVQIRDDVRRIVSLLAKAETGLLTQGIESDVIATLEEMVTALKKEIAESKAGKQKPGEGKAENPPLVEKLAELKLVRAMQARVNQRTEKIASLTEPEERADIHAILRDLAERQDRIHAITRDLAKELP